MPIRTSTLAAALGAVIAATTSVGFAQSRTIGLEPSRQARQLAPIVNETLGLARSQMSVVAIERAGGTGMTAQVSGITAQLLLGGEARTLELHPHSVRSPDYQLLVQQADGSLEPVPPGPIRTLRGKVAGIVDSQVAGSLDGQGLHALVLIPGKPRMWIEPLPATIAAGAGAHAIYTDADRLHDGPPCAAFAPPEAALNFTQAPPAIEDSAVTASGSEDNNTRWTELAVDSDVEFYLRHGSVAAVEAAIDQIINLTNIQYERDVDIGHYVVTIIVRPAEPDPYNASNPSNLLDQFRNHWFQFRANTHRDVAHFFTGRTLADGIGGIAYFSGICDDVEGYSLASWGTTFCTSLACHTDLTAHELGHNWAASHCTCPGWTMNPTVQAANRFHPDTSIPQILGYRNTRTCMELGDTLLGVTVDTPAAAIAENNDVPLSAFAEFEFSYDKEVTPLVSWSVDPPSLGSVSAEAVFSSNEVSGSASGTISATYTFDSVTKVGSMPVTVVDAQPAPLPDASMPNKVRYISVAPPAPGSATALQVRIVSLYAPDPPDTVPGPDFSGWQGSVYWIGQPQTCPDPSALGRFACAKLDCTPHYLANWGSQIIHVTAPEIMPSSTYEIRSYPASCQGAENECGLASAILTVQTQRWGDIVAPFQVPGGPRQPNAMDIAAAVDKVKSVQGSIEMPRAQLQPANLESADGVSAIDIAMVVDAVKGASYPLDGPCNCPLFFTCPFADECGRCLPP